METLSTWVIEVRGEQVKILEPEDGLLPPGLQSTIPKTEGIYQWRPSALGVYICDPAIGGHTSYPWGWEEGIIPKEEWPRDKLYPGASLNSCVDWA